MNPRFRYSVGVPDRTPPVRRKRRYANSKLTNAKVEAAHLLYWEQDLSLGELGTLLYRPLGYPNEKRCQHALWQAFLRDGLPLRSMSEACSIRNRKRVAAEALARG